jgi:hypothetical protein
MNDIVGLVGLCKQASEPTKLKKKQKNNRIKLK